MTTGMGLKEFLGHETSSGGRTPFLRKWKKRKPPAVNTWLHTRAPFTACWQHNWPRINVYDDRKTGETKREVWGGNFNCHEPEQVLLKQYRRDKETGVRDLPPSLCPGCLLIEAVRGLVVAEKIRLTEPLFVYAAGDQERVLTAGGIYNAYSDDYLTSAQKEEMRKAGIRADQAWMENAYSKCNYLFIVADNDEVETGIQIAMETTLLGDKVKQVIRDQIASQGDEDGNPLRKPYCIRWEHRPTAKAFGDRYHALAMPRIALTDEIRELIIRQDPPDISRIVAPGNVALFRSSLEEHATPIAKKVLDWDALFGKAEKMENDQAAEDPDLEFPPKDDGPAPNVMRDADPDGSAQRDQVQMVACDECKKPMRLDVLICPHCGHQYADGEEVVVQPPEPKLPTRAEARAKALPHQEPAAFGSGLRTPARPEREPARPMKPEDEDVGF